MIRHQEETFSLVVPEGWAPHHDTDQLFLVSSQPAGVLCCTTETVADTEELPNLSRMLAGFLTRSGHSVATDELLRITGVPGCEGFCWQYFEDGTFHRLWIFGNEASWLLLTFASATEHLDHFHPQLEGLIKTLELADVEGAR